jgi:hypothetical protein
MKRFIFAKRRGSLLTSAYTSTLSIASVTQPNLARTVTIPQFDSSLGVLFKIEIQLTTTARSTSRIENLDAVARAGTQSGANFVETASLGGSTLITNNIQVLFTNNLAAYDGLPDYGGSSGVSNARRTVSNTKSNFINTSFNYLFIGSGNVTLNINDVATGFVIGPIDYALAVVPETGVSVTVTYHYIESILPTVISGTIWEDYNGNGVMEPGEPGLAGVILSLFDEFGSPTAIPNATTDADGYYEFTGLTAGNYYVVYELPSGYTVTTDSDGVDGSNSMFVSVASGQTTSANVGMMIPPPPVISGIIWEDTDGDGIIGISEPRLSGITVSLLDEAGVPTGLTATSDVDGIYTFNLLSAGNYKISYTVPDGYITTYDYDGVDINNQFAFTASNGDVIDLFHIGFQLIP